MATAVAVDVNLETAGQGIHNRDPDTVETARDLVAIAPELAPCVQDRKDNLGCGEIGILVVLVDRDTATVVSHLTSAVGKKGHDYA